MGRLRSLPAREYRSQRRGDHPEEGNGHSLFVPEPRQTRVKFSRKLGGRVKAEHHEVRYLLKKRGKVLALFGDPDHGLAHGVSDADFLVDVARCGTVIHYDRHDAVCRPDGILELRYYGGPEFPVAPGNLTHEPVMPS